MTATRAYQILNVSPTAGWAEIERAYQTALQALHLQLIPGQPMTVRQKAQDQIAELKSAFEFLKNLIGQAGSAAAGQARPPVPIPQFQPMPTPAIPPNAVPQFQAAMGSPVQPTATMPNPFRPGQSVSTFPWVIPAGFILAAAVMLIVILLCLGSGISAKGPKTARLRVLSVPWSDVKVNGESLGPSGQVEAFALKPGRYTLSLWQGDSVLSRTIELMENTETVVEAQFEQGTIHAKQK